MGVKKVDMSKKIDAKALFETVKESLGPYALSPLILAVSYTHLTLPTTERV